MKKQHSLLLTILLGILNVYAADKSSYDVTTVRENFRTSLAKGTTGPLAWKLTRSVAELGVLQGGYFTFGTTAGVSAQPLEKNCGITFGHPYAKTSFPVIAWDGVWGKPENFFVIDTVAPVISGDTLVFTYVKTNSCRVRLTYVLTEGGQRLEISVSVKNMDVVAHQAGLGILIDPALGIRGDGVLSVDGTSLLRDTAIAGSSVVGKQLLLRERQIASPGLKCLLDFSNRTNAQLIAANWRDVEKNITPVFAPSPERRLYDMVLKIHSATAPLLPGAETTQSCSIELQTPDFGQQVFMRWDVPDFVGVEQGFVTPQNIPSIVSTMNVTGSQKDNLSIAMSSVNGLMTSTTVAPFSLAAQNVGYAKLALSVPEIYENRVSDCFVTCKSGNVLIDSLVQPVFIPATPVSDTGLTVVIDSLAKEQYPKVSVFFSAEKQSTKQKIVTLTPNNILCVENGVKIPDFALMKDTSQGAGRVDIVFVLDVTGSMSGAIDGVKNNITEFADSLVARNVMFRLGMVTFLDAVENVYDFTSDAAVFKSYVAAQYAHGGGDEPENSLDALYRASEMKFDESARKIFIWITDATYHQSDSYTSRTKQQVIDRLLTVGALVHAVGPTYHQVDWYNPIIEPTGGSFYDYTKNFRDILLDMARLKGITRYMLTYQAPAGSGLNRQIALTVHYGGLGGIGTTTYTAPGAEMRSKNLEYFPNPFNPSITFRFRLENLEHGMIRIYNVLGQEVRSYILDKMTAAQGVVWDARDAGGNQVSTGVYVVRCEAVAAGQQAMVTETSKILYLK